MNDPASADRSVFRDPRPRVLGVGPRRLAPVASRIRRKLVVLHTVFSLGLAAVLLLALRPAAREMVAQAEEREARLALNLLADALAAAPAMRVVSELPEVRSGVGSAADLGIPDELASAARAEPGTVMVAPADADGLGTLAARFDPATGVFKMARAESPTARRSVTKLYIVLTVCLLGVYGLIALTLELFVLPRQLYEPIERLRRADEAVQAGRREGELIPDRQIPGDELGDIMRSRNASILKLREQERQLGEAIARIEEVASELRRKNHLLETARRNLADQDRLASLGMMSAGIAHELNTPLAVIKGSVERMAEGIERGRPAPDAGQVQLMLRVVRRLEKLSESLLDFARVRPPRQDPVSLHEVADEAWTLVSLDRDARTVRFENVLSPEAMAVGDADRLTQVFVNLLRNAVDAAAGSPGTGRWIRVAADGHEREGRRWISITIADSGPGIDPSLFPRLFEPFASTRLDADGTGLGLAVAEGIVREHGGLLLARNAAPGEGGAVFEIMLPEPELLPYAAGDSRAADAAGEEHHA
ncbi:MAG: hypothetical protein IBJ11_04190 [Phycisphaerales bacterium]|nr:hypothetical protein [Phycisphaerales bacterium]